MVQARDAVEDAAKIAIAFGLGNRELAGEITRDWYERYRAEADAIERDVAEAEAAEQAEDEAEVKAANARRAARSERGRSGSAELTPALGTEAVKVSEAPAGAGAMGGLASTADLAHPVRREP